MNKIDAKHVNFFYGDFQALKDISMTIEEKKRELEKKNP